MHNSYKEIGNAVITAEHSKLYLYLYHNIAKILEFSCFCDSHDAKNFVILSDLKNN